ncbi:mitochondrial ribosome-associated GTPase 1-like isoform X2 [Bolinopsis microptera]
MTRVTDCIIEVHDARIPFTSRNTYANQSYAGRPRILLLAKADLVSPHELDMICKQISVKEGIPVCATSNTVKQKRKFRGLIKDGVSMANADQLTIAKPHYTFFVSGIPNVGKSSFINTFKKNLYHDKNKLKVAPHPGVTKKISNRLKILDAPKVYIYDTPGVNLPVLDNPESIMKLAACGAVPTTVVGQIQAADYILFWLNRKGQYKYAFQCGLAGPSNNIIEVLAYYARRRNLMLHGKPIINDAAEHFVAMFNKGELGQVILEDF